MSSMFRVTSGQLRSIAEQLRAMNQNFKGKVENLTQREQALNGMWEGEARKTFHNAYTKERVQFDNFYKGIEQYIRVLLEAAQEYERTEQTNTQIAGR